MTSRTSRLALNGLALGLLSLTAYAQIGVTSLGGQTARGAQLRPDRVLVVDASGQGDFASLPAAVSAAPERALLLIKPGSYAGATLNGKSLRLEAEVAGAAHLTGPLVIQAIAANQEVYVGGLFFEEGFEVNACVGEVSLAACTAINDGVLVPPPAGVHFSQYPSCGIGEGRHRITASAAVSLVDCSLEGRDGIRYPACDGSPGEHGLIAEDSRVTLYGCTLVGGDGSDAPGCHGAYAGAGGDGVLARGATTRVLACDAVWSGGTGGIDLEANYYNGCPGEPFRAVDGATVEECSVDHVTLEIAPLVSTGGLPIYTITAPPGADIFLMAAPRRGWREFVASEGVLHLGNGLSPVPLGVMSASGTLSRPFPAPRPAWVHGYASVELQVYARVAGQDRYSEPRSLQVVYPGL